MKISPEAVHKMYELSKKAYEGDLSRSDVMKIVETERFISKGSASDLIRQFGCMLRGELYQRTMNHTATEHFLRSIHRDYGIEALRTALKAARAHVHYYNGLGGGRQVGTERIIDAIEEEYCRVADGALYPEVLEDQEQLLEGAKLTVSVNSYERNVKAREKCLQYYGYNCSVCELNFEEVYGAIGNEFIHVHHLVDLAECGGEYQVDPIADLRPVCPNCHAMLHRTRPALSIEYLRDIVAGTKSDSR